MIPVLGVGPISFLQWSITLIVRLRQVPNTELAEKIVVAMTESQESIIELI